MKQINVDVSQKSNNSKVPKNLDTISQIIGEIDENALYFVDVNSKSFTVTHKQLVSQILESVLKNIPQVEGVGVSKIEKTSTEGLVDTYAVILTDGSTYYFTITNGKDGISATHSWNGTTLTITSASGTSSADLKGADGKDGDKGDKGDKGDTGYTPQKGTDYFTDEDKAEISEQAKELIDFSPYQPKTDETLETESKEIVGAINELHNKVDLKGNYLGNTSWMVLSDWEATHSYGKFNINGTVSYYDYSTRATVSFNIKSIQIGYHPSGNGAYDNIGFTRVDGAMTNFLNNTRVFTLDIVDGDDISNRYLLEWLLNFGIKTKGEYTEDKTVSEAIDEAKETLAILQSEIAGTTWMMLDFNVTLGFEYKFPFYSNGEKFTSMKYSGENYIFYLDYYRADGTSLRVCEYDFLNATHFWSNKAYREITTHFSSHYVFENSGIAAKQGAGTIPNQLDTNAKTLVGAVNELKADVKNVNTDVESVKRYAENVKHEVIVQAYYNEEDKKWYEDIDFTVVIPNISLFNITLDFNKKDVYFALGKVNLSDWFATAEKHTALANGVNAFQKAYDNTIEKIFGTKNEELETESKIIVGAVNELNKKISSSGEKVTDLTGKTYYIPSGWEVTKEYGKFDVIAFIGGETTKTFEALNLGYGTTYKPELYGSVLSARANAMVFGKPDGRGLLVDSSTKLSSFSGFTVTFTGGTDVTNTALIDWLDTWGTLESPYQTKHDENLETESKEIVGAINELNDKINATGGGSTEEMPQIRFVGMPCRGYLGWVDWSQIDDDQTDSYENLKFTIEIVSGTLQVGDAIQLCRMSKYSGSKSYAHDGTKKYHPPKRKLRRLFEYTITEEDLEKRFITFEVPWNDKKAIKLFTKWATSGVNDKTIYFRIRRPKGEINSGSNGGGMTVDAEFSNVVSIRCLSYGFEWYPNGEDIEFYQIRIT